MARLILTIDDLPVASPAFRQGPSAVSILQRFWVALTKRPVPAVLFSIPGRATGEIGRAFRILVQQAPHRIEFGNHTFSHCRCSATALEAYLEDVDRATAALRGLGKDVRWFRPPFLDVGDSECALRAALDRRGLYLVLCDLWLPDWEWDEQYQSAVSRGLAMDEQSDVVVQYVEACRDTFADAARAASRHPATIILHSNVINSLVIGTILDTPGFEWCSTEYLRR